MIGSYRLHVALRDARRAEKLTQLQLAAKARVSLATIQNIEAGKANPEVATLESISEALGLRLHLSPVPVDFGELATLGVPLMDREVGRSRGRESPTSEELIACLNRIAPALQQLDPRRDREGAATLSFLCALRDHYPSVWSRISELLDHWLEAHLSAVSPKLRRLALRNLGSYL